MKLLLAAAILAALAAPALAMDMDTCMATHTIIDPVIRQWTPEREASARAFCEKWVPEYNAKLEREAHARLAFEQQQQSERTARIVVIAACIVLVLMFGTAIAATYYRRIARWLYEAMIITLAAGFRVNRARQRFLSKAINEAKDRL